jgi:thioester reductase-like protein
VAPSRDVVLVTGYPGFIARRLVARMAQLRRERPPLVVALARPRHAEAARRELAETGLEHDVLEGDVTRMHLGLSGAEYKRLAREVTELWHLAAHYDLSADPRLIRAVNVEGTRGVVDLARAARRARLHHFSSAYVSGDREGVVLEDELDEGQRFDDAYARSKFEAERIVRRAQAELAATIYRPSMVVGDSRTGEIDRFEGPYFLALLLVATPLAVPLPLPAAGGGAPLNVVPVDFVVEAALGIAASPAAAGKTVHVVDPAPLPVRRVYEMIAARVGNTLPPMVVPHRAVDAILRLPFLERVARPQRSALQHVNRLVIYNCRNMLDLLAGTGIRCPSIASYLDRLVDYVKSHQEEARAAATLAHDAEDPLAPPATPPGAAP